MKQIILFLTFSTLSTGIFAQKNTKQTKPEMRVAETISDSLINSEMSYFTVNGSKFKNPSQEISEVLTEYSLISCDDNCMLLSMSSFFSFEGTFIHLYFKEENSNKVLDSIFLVTHSHCRVHIPDSSYQGVDQLNICEQTSANKKKSSYSPFFRAFHSLDNRRLYIYILGGSDSERYEVTWVIFNSKFYKRILERI